MVRRLASFRFGVVVAAAAVASGMLFTSQPASAQSYISLEIENIGGISYATRLCDSYISNLGVGAGDVIWASNGCNGRLWLHRLSDGGGASYCVSPNTAKTIPPSNQATESVTATTNPNRCL
jgi:hypothetical protein